jgi:hypothetical protein
VLALSGCGGSSGGAATAAGSGSNSSSTVASPTAASLMRTAAVSTSAMSTDPPTTPTSSPRVDDTASMAPADGTACSDATVEVNKAVNAMPEGEFVVDIEIQGVCTVSLKTGYGQDNAASALKLCQAAETPAYANGAVGVSVVGNGVELAAGTKKSPCVLKV